MNNATLSWIIVASGLILNILCVISIVFIERKKPNDAIAWILVLNFLPIVGVLFYCIIGGKFSISLKKQIKNKKVIDVNYKKYLNEQLSIYNNPEINFKSEEMRQYADMIYMHINQSSGLISFDNDIKLFIDASKKYNSLIDDINNAKSTINIEYFIFRDDDWGGKILDALTNAAKRGVEVKLIYDEFGCLPTKMRTFKRLTDAGGKVTRFFSSKLTNLIRANYRNHRKIVVIDGTIGYTGGMNIGKEYTGDWKKGAWRDTHLRFEGHCVKHLQVRFLLDWIYSSKDVETYTDIYQLEKYFPKLVNDKPGNIPVQIVSSGPDVTDEYIKYGLVKMINSAKKTLFIQTPYFVPDDTFLECLKIAKASGIDVRVMIPGIPDKDYVYSITMSYIEPLLQCGIKVYLYNGFLHSKAIVMDGCVSSIGTTNIDMRSFALNFEVNAFIYNKEFSEQYNNIFLQDMKNCRELTLDEFQKRGLWRKTKESIFRLFSPLA